MKYTGHFAQISRVFLFRRHTRSTTRIEIYTRDSPESDEDKYYQVQVNNGWHKLFHSTDETASPLVPMFEGTPNCIF